MHDVLIIGVPLVVLLAGILLNRSDFKDLRADATDQLKGMKADAAARHTEVLARFNMLASDMRQFYHLTGKLEARMDAVEKR
jgi:hypothetical protein